MRLKMSLFTLHGVLEQCLSTCGLGALGGGRTLSLGLPKTQKTQISDGFSI